MAQYLYLILSLYPKEVLEKVGEQVLHAYLLQCINNQNAETRTLGRKSFLLYQAIDTGSADQLFQQLEQST